MDSDEEKKIIDDKEFYDSFLEQHEYFFNLFKKCEEMDEKVHRQKKKKQISSEENSSTE